MHRAWAASDFGTRIAQYGQEEGSNFQNRKN